MVGMTCLVCANTRRTSIWFTFPSLVTNQPITICYDCVTHIGKMADYTTQKEASDYFEKLEKRA